MEPSNDHSDWEQQLRTLRASLQLSPEQVDITKLAPVFIPSKFLSQGNWVGPYMLLRAKCVALTWSVLLPDMAMRYVDHDLVRYWDANGFRWRDTALNNLAQHSENLGTHDFRRDDGTLYAIGMMHDDGIGPSRLLLHERLSQLFPKGYRVALPEMSCGIALSRELETGELEKLTTMIDHCYRKGTRPLAPGIFAPADLQAA